MVWRLSHFCFFVINKEQEIKVSDNFLHLEGDRLNVGNLLHTDVKQLHTMAKKYGIDYNCLFTKKSIMEDYKIGY